MVVKYVIYEENGKLGIEYQSSPSYGKNLQAIASRGKKIISGIITPEDSMAKGIDDEVERKKARIEDTIGRINARRKITKIDLNDKVNNIIFLENFRW